MSTLLEVRNNDNSDSFVDLCHPERTHKFHTKCMSGQLEQYLRSKWSSWTTWSWSCLVEVTKATESKFFIFFWRQNCRRQFDMFFKEFLTLLFSRDFDLKIFDKIWRFFGFLFKVAKLLKSYQLSTFSDFEGVFFRYFPTFLQKSPKIIKKRQNKQTLGLLLFSGKTDLLRIILVLFKLKLVKRAKKLWKMPDLGMSDRHVAKMHFCRFLQKGVTDKNSIFENCY